MKTSRINSFFAGEMRVQCFQSMGCQSSVNRQPVLFNRDPSKSALPSKTKMFTNVHKYSQSKLEFALLKAKSTANVLSIHKRSPVVAHRANQTGRQVWKFKSSFNLNKIYLLFQKSFIHEVIMIQLNGYLAY